MCSRDGGGVFESEILDELNRAKFKTVIVIMIARHTIWRPAMISIQFLKTKILL